jgi:Flp pilus assembly pilin Flp
LPVIEHNWMVRLLSRLRLETGQTMSEYAVVLLVLVPGAVVVFTGLSDSVVTGITNVARLFP